MKPQQENLLTILTEAMDDLVPIIRKKIIRWIHFMKHDFLNAMTLFIVVDFSWIIAVSLLTITASLINNPAAAPIINTTAAVDADQAQFDLSMMQILSILPFTLFLEDLGIRWMPWFFMKNILRLGSYEVSPNPEKRAWRIRLAHNLPAVFIVVSGLFSASLHLTNINNANFFGAFLYFMIHLFNGIMFAWIYKYKGFWECYTTHVSWDFLLITIAIVSTLLWGVIS